MEEEIKLIPMILLTGGTGLLGTELQKHIKVIAPRSEVLDITKNVYQWFQEFGYRFSLIVHAAAMTDLNRIEKDDKSLAYQVNVIGTRDLASLGIPMLYISTEYVFDGDKGNYKEEDFPNPRNFYALTKLLGEYESRKTKSVVLRCLFKPRPFQHLSACIDQFTTGDYVDITTKKIATAINNFNRLPPTIHIGTGKKSTYELAKQTRPNVNPISINDISTVTLPKDTSLNTSLWDTLNLE